MAGFKLCFVVVNRLQRYIDHIVYQNYAKVLKTVAKLGCKYNNKCGLKKFIQ